MSRTVPEWIGKTDDEPVPPRVRARVWLRDEGQCQCCTREINAGERWVADHIIAIINGGENRETNLQAICDWCDRKVKTPADVAEKSRTARIRAKHIGIKRSASRPMPHGRGSKTKRKFSGEVVSR